MVEFVKKEFEYEYEVPREMTEEHDRKMARNMIKTIEKMDLPASTHNKIKGLYI